jgi:alpha-L-rhamnosidase
MLFVLVKVAAASACSMTPTHLRTNNLVSPLGIPSTHAPLLSWSLADTASPPTRGLVQSAYQIRASSSPSGMPMIWDSGKVASSETLQLAYGGPTLLSSERVWWRVVVWDGADAECQGSAPDAAFFEQALVGEAGWAGAEWLARYAQAPNASGADGCKLYNASSARNEVPRFRAEFDVQAGIKSARAYVVGLGYYQLFIDGARVGTSYLDPGWTTYSKTTLYSTYDVTSFFAPASKSSATSTHAVGVELGNGWWNPLPLKFWGHVDLRGAVVQGEGRGKGGSTSEPMFRLLIVATLASGAQRTLVKSSSDGGAWRAGGSPTLLNSIYLGERYDATRDAAYAGWSTAGFSASGAGWGAPALAASDDVDSLGPLEAQAVPPIRRVETLRTTTVSTARATDGGVAGATTLILDTGKNHAGVCRFRARGAAGSALNMRYGELLMSTGELNPMTSVAGQIKGPTENTCIENRVIGPVAVNHTAVQSDVLVLSGGAEDDWTPSWSWHGFRYVEITLPPGAALTAPIECYVMRSDVDLISNFTSSDPFLAEMHTVNQNTFDSNMMSIQSDCPHRERFGYGGDPLGCGEAGLSIYDWSAFYRKRVRDVHAAARVLPGKIGDVNGSAEYAPGGAFGGFSETSPFVNIADRSLVPHTAAGPIGWETYAPVAQVRSDSMLLRSVSVRRQCSRRCCKGGFACAAF